MKRKIAGILTLMVGILAAEARGTPGMAAALGHPEPWQIGLQEAATPVMHGINNFHNALLVIVTLIAGFVLTLLVIVIVRFNHRANPVPSRTTHNTLLEVLWTIIPVVILVSIAIPSFRLLYLQRVIPQGDMTVKITGNQWFWSYEYPDNGGISFDSNILSDEDAAAKGLPRHLGADNAMVVPIHKTVRIIVTATDVIHSWTIPSFGSKIDAIPGRLNEDWFNIETAGIYFGQCSELCGKDHAFMPIMVRAVPEDEFNAWVDKAKASGVDEANKIFAVLPKPATQSVATVEAAGQ